MDTPENRKDYRRLGGFKYRYCGRSADHSERIGCRRGYHQAADGKRGKYGYEDSGDELCPSDWDEAEIDEDDDEDDNDEEEEEEKEGKEEKEEKEEDCKRQNGEL
ncbi:hypothetical protein QBC32DRAFT_340653 [Pseudoneurospora amorphoporcata]|uniref:Uncharacterized protein n=1 Tax=Pseudoneurospora amorphoporcata TaxID=241081 RepID=A0AAN6SGL5_9PEZI|nr:hypothetical protein QBC32DRAFT_340653 [Pseudoneurospora amorphoporcata]